MAKRKFDEALESDNILEQAEKSKGRKGATTKRTKQLLVGFNEEEFELLKKRMTERNKIFVPFAEFIRDCALGRL
jgi:L-2-hydroxyglutarate oxidase LhgO